ncbi:serine hydrolase FSH [Hypoxylon cercidicola]|nr:serine hydrolase FSH [Hypoxylon cercidicola]
MKFLCLHGGGTNSHVMDLQTAPLRHELEDGHEYEFVEGVLRAPMSQGVEALSSSEDNFFAYYDPKDLATLKHSIAQLDDYISTEGPFDAIMGFSAGAVLAAMYMIDRQRRNGSVPFRCAVFLSSAESTSEMSFLGVGSHDIIRIPTAHIWGANDTLAPTGGGDLCRICDPDLQLTAIHDGGHEIPKKSYLTETVHVIRRTVFSARSQEIERGA